MPSGNKQSNIGGHHCHRRPEASQMFLRKSTAFIDSASDRRYFWDGLRLDNLTPVPIVTPYQRVVVTIDRPLHSAGTPDSRRTVHIIDPAHQVCMYAIAFPSTLIVPNRTLSSSQIAEQFVRLKVDAAMSSRGGGGGGADRVQLCLDKTSNATGACFIWRGQACSS